MKKLFLSVLALFSISTFVNKAEAFLDLRLNYGVLASNVDLNGLCPSCGSIPSIAPTYGLGVDAIVTLPLPLIPGIGLRYEKMGLTASASGVDFKADNTRTSLILNWHLIDTLLYIGPIITYGLNHDVSLTIDDHGSRKGDLSGGTKTSFSIGVEAGVHLLGFLVGGELGYMDYRWKDAKDSTGTLPTQDINLSGTYGKIAVGLSF